MESKKERKAERNRIYYLENKEKTYNINVKRDCAHTAIGIIIFMI